MHDRFNSWLATVLLGVGLSSFAILGVQIFQSARALYAVLRAVQVDEEARSRPAASAWSDRFIIPQSQRTWADLFAACRLSDAWLGSDVWGEPVCYPMGQTASVLEP